MFVVFHHGNPHYDKRFFKTRAGAKRSQTCGNRNAGSFVYFMLEQAQFEHQYPVGMKVVKNLMTGKEVEIAEDTPWCCNPASESYWSM
jgi:hypothetical protein